MSDTVKLPNKIAEARKAKGWTQAQLGALIDVSQQAIQRYETGQRDIAASKLILLSRVLGVTVAYLLCMTDQEDSPQLMVDIPLFESVAADTPIDMDAAGSEYPIPYSLYNRWPSSFFLRVNGESMNRILPNGCLALIEPCTTIEYDGQPHAVCVDEHVATVKRVNLLSDGFELVPDSTEPTFKRLAYERGDESGHTLSVIGRVVWHCLPYDWHY